jgi:hypothetical protein
MFRLELKIDYSRERQVLRVGWHCSDVLYCSDATGNVVADAA